jgi:hypothetical protein
VENEKMEDQAFGEMFSPMPPIYFQPIEDFTPNPGDYR